MSRIGMSVVVAALAGGCAGDAPAPPTVSVRDSMGVQIIETFADARFETSWSVGEQVWAIGELEGDPDYLLSRVEGAMQLPSGDVVIANGGTNELRFYGSTGRHQETVGREGEGPGEFEYLRALGRCRSDGFVAYDLNWQANAYLFDGTFVDKTVLRTPDGFTTPYEVACDTDGHRLMLGWGREVTDEPRVGFYQAHDQLLLTGADGEITVELGRRLVSERIGTQFGSRPHPAGRQTVFGLHDHTIYIGSGEHFEVEVLGMDGAVQRLLRGPAVSLVLTDSIRNQSEAAQLSQVSEARRPEARTDMAGWEWPESIPAYTDLRVDSEGVVWLRAYQADPFRNEIWSLLDPTAGYLGDLTLGPRQTLLEVGADYLLVLTKDDLDVERVEKYLLYRDTA